jgi:hypothetical protein
MEPQEIGDTETMNYAAERFIAQSFTHTHTHTHMHWIHHNKRQIDISQSTSSSDLGAM